MTKIRGRRGHERVLFALAPLFAVGLLALPAPAQAAWNQPVGGASPINQASDQPAFQPSMTSIGGVPYVAWDEDDGTNSELRVSRLNSAGTAWEQIGGGPSPINQASDRSAMWPALAEIGGVPYVVWAEFDGFSREVRVARLNAAGTGWEQVVGGASPINEASNEFSTAPTLTSVGGVPYVAWTETDGTNEEIRVSRLNAAGTAWEQVVGGASPINQANNQDGREAIIANVGGVLYVAWTETDGTNFELRVTRLNAAGTAWVQVGGGASPINQAANQDASDLSLASIGGVPYLAWDESDGTNTEIRVSRLNAAGTGWEQVVGGPSPVNNASDQSTSEPSLTGIGGVPYVSWSEFDGTNAELRVARLNASGTAWQQPVGGASPINQANDRPAFESSLTAIGGIPYVAWEETDGTNRELRVSRLEPEFLAPAMTATKEESATFSVDVKAFGLPYEIGFDYGPGFASQTATTQTSGETETVTQSVAGLKPSTSYALRPFARAGVPAPTVLGGEVAFTTAADVTPPELKLAGKKAQHLGGFVAVKASCPSEGCELEATGALVVDAGRAGRSELKLSRFKLKRAHGQAAAGTGITLKPRITPKARKTASKALEHGGTVRAVVVVAASDAAGNRVTARRTVKLR